MNTEWRKVICTNRLIVSVGLLRVFFGASKNNVRRYIIQFGAALLLTVCLCGHVSELFDRWDHTLATGQDVDFSVVLVAVIAGAVFGLAHAASAIIRARSISQHFSCLLTETGPKALALTPQISHSPPIILQI